MEKVFSSDITRFLIVLGIAVAALAAWMNKIISSIAGSMKVFQKATLIYLFLSLCAFCLIAVVERLGSFENTAAAFIFFQVSFLLLGVVNIYLMRRFLPRQKGVQSFRLSLLFTVLAGLLGSVGFLLLYHFLHHNKMEYSMWASALFFTVPFFFYHTFKQAVDIPPKVLKRWFYPLHEEMAEPGEKELKNLLVISFEFQKQAGNHHFTNFRAKAPVNMEFGKLFYYFINDYNERHPDDKIQFINNSGEANAWVFYRKPRWFSISTSYKDADKTVFANAIRENDVIICTRV